MKEMKVLSFTETTNLPSARDLVPGCPVVGSPIPRSHRCPWCATASPRDDLHLEIDIIKINQQDVDWIKRNCTNILPEIKQLYLDYHGISEEYNKTLSKYDETPPKLPSIMKKPRKMCAEVSSIILPNIFKSKDS